MGSHPTESQNGKVAIDATVGGLLWVQRRNGSWWPGQIMGLDEVTDDKTASPGSGTPVKLLGRKDVIIDWYDLEKSKRVKAFRCGEYDDAIEQAKVAAANPARKKVRYARREDAILCALEIENTRVPRDGKNDSSRADSSDGEQGRDGAKVSPVLFHPSAETSSREGNSSSVQGVSHSGLSYEDANGTNGSKEQDVKFKRPRTPCDSEDDGNEGAKRMRGLDDLGPGSERKVQAGALTDVPNGNVSLISLVATNHLSANSLANSGRGIMPSFKKKRSKVVFHETLKRKNRRRPLMKVMENDTLVSVPINYGEFPPGFQGMPDGKMSGMVPNESRRSISVAVNNNSDSAGLSCDNGVSANGSEPASDATGARSKLKEPEISSWLDFSNNVSGKLFDVPFDEEDCHAGLYPVLNSSSLKLHVDARGGYFGHNGQAEPLLLGNETLHESGSNSSAGGHMGQMTDKGASMWQSKGRRKSRQWSKNEDTADLQNLVDVGGLNEMASSRHLDRLSPIYHGNGFAYSGLESQKVMGGLLDGLLSPMRSVSYRRSRFTGHSGLEVPEMSMRNMCVDSVLYDVNIEVKASYRSQHVPYISLMSKLNGKAITGHPVTVEALGDGAVGLLVDSSEYYPTSDSFELENEDVQMDFEFEPKAGSRKPPTKVLKRSSRLPRSSSGKPPKAKKLGARHGSLSKKTRKLSSLTSSRRLTIEDKKPLIATLKGTSALACIPLRVVFSRINEALNDSAGAAVQPPVVSDIS